MTTMVASSNKRSLVSVPLQLKKRVMRRAKKTKRRSKRRKGNSSKKREKTRLRLEKRNLKRARCNHPKIARRRNRLAAY